MWRSDKTADDPAATPRRVPPHLEKKKRASKIIKPWQVAEAEGVEVKVQAWYHGCDKFIARTPASVWERRRQSLRLRP